MKITAQIQTLEREFHRANGGLHAKYGWMHPDDYWRLVKELHAWSPRGLPLRFVRVSNVAVYPIDECPPGKLYLTREILGGRCV